MKEKRRQIQSLNKITKMTKQAKNKTEGYFCSDDVIRNDK